MLLVERVLEIRSYLSCIKESQLLEILNEFLQNQSASWIEKNLRVSVL